MVRCCSASGKKKDPRKPLTEFFVDGILLKTEKSGKKNNKGIVKRCTRIRKRRQKYKKRERIFEEEKGDQQFTVEGRNAEITVDLVLQARAKMGDNNVNEPEDVIVTGLMTQS